MKLVIDYEWIEVGEILQDSSGKLLFPDLDARPAVYCFQFLGGPTESNYIGETDNLRRRAAHYRNPGPSQRTHIRLNKRMLAHFASRGRVTLKLITQARIEVDGCAFPLDITEPVNRKILENTALLQAKRGGSALENA